MAGKAPQSEQKPAEPTPGAVALLLMGVLAVATVALMTQRVLLNSVLLWLHSNAWVLVVLAVASGLSAIAQRRKRPSLLGLTWLLTILALVVGAFAVSYLRAGVYAQSIETATDRPVPGFAERAPFVVARAQAASLVTTNGALGDTTFLADPATYASIVATRSPIGGYAQVVESTLDVVSGEGDTRSCDVDREAAGLRLGGLFASSLARAIIGEAGYGTVIAQQDAYGYCADGVPFVVVPLQQQTGLFPATRVPAGVALYDGATGELEIVADPAAAGIPGPVYPITLAQTQRESTRATEGFWAFTFATRGFAATDETTSAQAEEEDGTQGQDANQGNTSEFNLALVDGGTSYVTPLRYLGRGTAKIVALSQVASDTATPGELNPLTVLVLPAEQQRLDNRTVEESIRTQHDNLGWASGLDVFEVAPIDGDTWVATIGMSRTVSYRAYYDVATERVTIVEIGTARPDPSEPADPDLADLADLTDAELLELQRRIIEELQGRLTAP